MATANLRAGSERGSLAKRWDRDRLGRNLGCFWGAEKAFWSLRGVYVTAVGYSGGTTPNPTYEEVCTGMTGQNEVVLVVYEPAKLSFDALLRAFLGRA